MKFFKVKLRDWIAVLEKKKKKNFLQQSVASADRFPP